MAETPKTPQFDDDPDLQAEIDAALGDQSLDDIMAAAEPPASSAPGEGTMGSRPVDPDDPTAEAARRMPNVPTGRLNPGDRVSARVVMAGVEDVFVELGPKRQGVCGRDQWGEDDAPAPGEIVDFIVNRYDASESLFYLTRVGSVSKADWEHLQVGQVVEARCTGTNKGGLEMEVVSHRAFMPAGQVGLYRVEDLGEYVGKTLTCEVIEFNREKRNIVLSAREVLVREQAEAREKMWETLEVGQSVTGVVRKLMPFGAFVDLGGVDGLIHISDLSYARVNNPGDVVSEGQSVTVQVLKIDRDNDRIGLGLKQCQADPFQTVTDSIQPGDTVTGRVTRTADFGAFVELQPGVEGLIHISELSHERVNRVDQVVKKDEVVTAQVLDVDPGSRRISLSIKALTAAEDAMQERPEDASIAKLRAKFGGDGELKGGIF